MVFPKSDLKLFENISADNVPSQSCFREMQFKRELKIKQSHLNTMYPRSNWATQRG